MVTDDIVLVLARVVVIHEAEELVQVYSYLGLELRYVCSPSPVRVAFFVPFLLHLSFHALIK